MASINQHTVISDILKTVDTITAHMIADGYRNLVQNYSAAILSVLTLFTLFCIYRLKNGSLSANTCTEQLGKMLFFYMLATNWSFFYIIIYDIFTNEPAHITRILISSSGEVGLNHSTASALDTMFDQGMHQASILFGMVSYHVSAFAYIFGGLCIAAATILLCILALAMMMYAKIALALVLFLAPLFCLFALFNSTKGWFEGWLRQCLNFALIPILVCGVLMIILSLGNVVLQPLTKSVESGHPSYLWVTIYLVLGIITLLLLKQTYGKAAALSGGFALSHVGAAFASAKNAVASTMGAGSSAYKGGKSMQGKISEKLADRSEKREEKKQQAAEAQKRRTNWNLM